MAEAAARARVAWVCDPGEAAAPGARQVPNPNTKRVCGTAPVPGGTKVWQYVTLTKRVFLIDCPGVVYHRTADSDTDAVLKGVVRVENLDGDSVGDHVAAVLARVAPALGAAVWGTLVPGIRSASSYPSGITRPSLVVRGALTGTALPISATTSRSPSRSMRSAQRATK